MKQSIKIENVNMRGKLIEYLIVGDDNELKQKISQNIEAIRAMIIF